MAQNPIFKGFPWSQAFTLPTGTMEVGDGVYAEFRYALTDKDALARVDSEAGIDVDGDRLTISLTAEQTAPLQNGSVLTSFVITRGGADIPIGVIIKIPVTLLPTRP